MNLLAKNDYLIEKIIEDPSYRILKDGRIFTTKTKTGKNSINKVWREVCYDSSSAYLRIKYNNKNISVHRIIYRAHCGKLSSDKIVNHRDYNTLNNHYKNLELMTQRQNVLHKYKKQENRKINFGNSKINFEIANQIRKDYFDHGFSYDNLVKKYNLSKANISNILKNKIWIKEKGELYCKKRTPIRIKKEANYCPKWVNLNELAKFYKKTPKNKSVDHIIPINHPNVCGLHVPWNLQYLSASENSTKHNNFDGTYNNLSWKKKIK